MSTSDDAITVVSWILFVAQLLVSTAGAVFSWTFSSHDDIKIRNSALISAIALVQSHVVCEALCPSVSSAFIRCLVLMVCTCQELLLGVENSLPSAIGRQAVGCTAIYWASGLVLPGAGCLALAAAYRVHCLFDWERKKTSVARRRATESSVP